MSGKNNINNVRLSPEGSNSSERQQLISAGLRIPPPGNRRPSFAIQNPGGITIINNIC